MSGSRDNAPDTPVRQLSQRPSESAHDHPNRAGHTKLGRRSPQVVEIHEQPKAVDITDPKTHHHVLPVGAPRQFVEERARVPGCQSRISSSDSIPRIDLPNDGDEPRTSASRDRKPRCVGSIAS